MKALEETVEEETKAATNAEEKAAIPEIKQKISEATFI